MAFDLCPEFLGGLGVAGRRTGALHHPAVGLELGEALLEQRTGAFASDRADQVDRHVVVRFETRAQRVGAPGRQPRQRPRVEAGLPVDDRVALDVDATPPGPPGQLGVLPRRQVGVGLTVVLDQLLDDHGAGRHVDAQRQRLGGEDHLDQALGEALFDDRLEGRQQAGVVGGDAATEGLDEGVPVERVPVGGGQATRMPVGDLEQPAALGAGGQPQPRAEQLADRLVAAGPAEDEEDRRQQAAFGERLDRPIAARRGDGAGPALTAGVALLDLAAYPSSPGLATVVTHRPGLGLGELGQLGVDPPGSTSQWQRGGCVPLEEVVEPAADEHVLVERHRAAFADDDLDLAAHLVEPFTEFLGVADGRRQRDQGDAFGKP